LYFNPRPPRGERRQHYQKTICNPVVLCCLEQSLPSISKNI
jgi:hypothetical protein